MIKLLKAFIALFNATCYITEQGLKAYDSSPDLFRVLIICTQSSISTFVWFYRINVNLGGCE